MRVTPAQSTETMHADKCTTEFESYACVAVWYVLWLIDWVQQYNTNPTIPISASASSDYYIPTSLYIHHTRTPSNSLQHSLALLLPAHIVVPHTQSRDQQQQQQ